MKKALFVDCCLRPGSNTRKLAEAFIDNLSKEYKVKHLKLEDENLKPLVGEWFYSRQEILDTTSERTHPRFDYAHEFAEADLIVIAAPFWDLSFPALLKIYIENVSIDGVTFTTGEEGLKGLCKANNLVYLTTRGGFYNDSPMESALPQLRNLSEFFGIQNFHSIGVDGMNVEGYDAEASLNEAIKEASELAQTF